MKKYQVFVSSTYLDLQEERTKVIKSLLDLNCIPAGMEMFPASDEDQWSLIQRIIDESDYFILLLGGKYGSTTDEGISYTELEYRYALEKKKPIIAFLHQDIESLPFKKVETDATKIDRLNDFRKLAKKKLCKMWRNPDDLSTSITTSLVNLFYTHPSPGWIKGDLIQTSHNLYHPTRVFDATSAINDEFEKEIQNSLQNTKAYLFRGVSGKRVACRINHSEMLKHDVEVYISMPHPKNDKHVIDEKASHRMRSKSEYDYEFEINKIKKDISISLVGLFEIRNKCRIISISFQRDCTTSRLEVFDDCVYATLYESSIIERKYNPPILQYDASTIQYQEYSTSAKREHDLCSRFANIIITRDTNLNEFIQYLKSFPYGPSSIEEYNEIKEQYLEFDEKFLNDRTQKQQL